MNFYPRSPCGERHFEKLFTYCSRLYFYPRSPCGERPAIDVFLAVWAVISIHALLAESDPEGPAKLPKQIGFLSTLSLRRATGVLYCHLIPNNDFYPRSPCGERPGQNLVNGIRLIISIHALLAESDLWDLMGDLSYDNFYPRSPCGERHISSEKLYHKA